MATAWDPRGIKVDESERRRRGRPIRTRPCGAWHPRGIKVDQSERGEHEGVIVRFMGRKQLDLLGEENTGKIKG